MANSRNAESPLPLRLARFFLGLLNALLLVALALVLLPLVMHYFKHANSYWWIEQVEIFDARMIRWVKSVIPTNFKGHELARWFIVAGILAARIWIDTLRRKVSTAIYRSALQRDFEALKSAAPAGADERVLAPVKEKMKTMDARNAKSRAELLKVMAEAKRQLESMGRDLAFLAIDVVDSTKMKLGEDKTFIEHDFYEYKNLVDGKLRSNGSLKAAWTPDGVMACFPTIDAALKAAKEVISGLDAFNANVKMIKSDFRVRCGVNAGHVYYDEQTPMEEMSDRVIDIAGHMQKYALPGTIACAKQIIEPVQQRGGFSDAGKVVDGYEVYQWTPADCLQEDRAAS
jgi:class 3 adenylate cyclase